MVGSTRFSAVLDACVLYPVTIANILIEFAWQDTYSAKWTKKIDAEWSQALLRNRPDVSPEKLSYRLRKMHQAIPDWEIKPSKFKKIIPTLQLPDTNDRHVLAAAIAAQVDFIVTINLKDFPTKIVDQYGIKTIHPDDFLMFHLTLEPIKSLEIVKNLRKRHVNPYITELEFIISLQKSGLSKTANHLQRFIKHI